VDIATEEYWKLLLLIHVHDIMKHAATPDSAIIDPNSHASLARKFLAEFSDDEDLQNIVQAHDENLALWLKFKTNGKVNSGVALHSSITSRLEDRVINKIKDIELLLLFQIIDGATEGKTDMKEMLRWFVDEVNKYRPTQRVYKALELFGL
jgi:Holliday junction resolvasome RuvABC ATP-dependent DNA helicase subunit